MEARPKVVWAIQFVLHRQAGRSGLSSHGVRTSNMSQNIPRLAAACRQNVYFPCSADSLVRIGRVVIACGLGNMTISSREIDVNSDLTEDHMISIRRWNVSGPCLRPVGIRVNWNNSPC